MAELTSLSNSLGLSDKEAQIYQLLLEEPHLSPPEVAERSGESRTNSYALLDSLAEKGLARRFEVNSKYVYAAKNPVELKSLINQRQQQIETASQQLESLIPDLLSQYNLAQNQPGVLHMEGADSLRKIYDDVLRQGCDIAIWPSRHDRDNPTTAEIIDQQIERQVEAGVKSRVLLGEESELKGREYQLKAKGISVRYTEQPGYEAQVMIYDDNVAFTTFTQGVVSTVLNNSEIAATMQAIFDLNWQQASDPLRRQEA